MEILFYVIILIINIVITFFFLKNEYDSYKNNKRFNKQLNEHEIHLLDIASVCTDSKNLIISLRDKTSSRIFKEHEELQETFKQIKKGITQEYKDFLESVRNVNEFVSVVKKENKKEPYTPIETLGLSARALNALVNNGIGSIEQLSKYTYDKIYGLRGVGHLVCKDIEGALKKMNIVLPNNNTNDTK